MNRTTTPSDAHLTKDERFSRSRRPSWLRVALVAGAIALAAAAYAAFNREGAGERFDDAPSRDGVAARSQTAEEARNDEPERPARSDRPTL